MNKISFVLAMVLLVITWVPTHAQSGITSTWKAESTPPGTSMTLVLRAAGSHLTGAARGCGAPPIQISEGKIDGNRITFECNYADGSHTLLFNGILNGDEIEFSWELHVRDGGVSLAPSNRLLGPLAPPKFIAKRVPDSTDAELVDLLAQVRGMDLAAAVNSLKEDVKGEGRFFLPENITRARAVIVVINWGDIAEKGVYGDPQIRKLLATSESGLLLARITNITEIGIDNRAQLRKAGQEVLLLLLQRLAQDSGHKELAEAPLLFWGHSAYGGSSLAAVLPLRTIGFVNYDSTVGGQEMMALGQIPGLLLAGGKDKQVPAAGVQLSWKAGRSVDAPWTFAVDPEATHGNPTDLEKANKLVIPWIAAVLQQRIPATGTTLRTVTDSSAWLGNIQSGEIAPSGTFAGSKPDATWLPDEASALGWQVVTAK